jgi:hypothetical protein
MRLLNSSSLELKDFMGGLRRPWYAILSHTWQDEEVTFQDMQRGLEYATTKKGFAKIQGLCAQARRDEYEWVWIDACCIDKSSSAELSEAINSMYRWYQEARVCYIYLSDVGPVSNETSPSAMESILEKSRWFSRGWTLQELLAPRFLEFYASDWSEIGTNLTLTPAIIKITAINESVFRGKQSLASCTIAERLSWMANRKTTREEDMAYCLLGIFDVHMPLLYGEGKRAFARLQEEILRRTEDFSLLLWQVSEFSVQWHDPPREECLARHPTEFETLSLLCLGSVCRLEMSCDVNGRHHFPWKSLRSEVLSHQCGGPKPTNIPAATITNRGLFTSMPIMYLPRTVLPDHEGEESMKTQEQEYGRQCLAFTHCVVRPNDEAQKIMYLCILLSVKPLSEDGAITATRVRPFEIAAVDSLSGFHWTELYLFIGQTPSDSRPWSPTLSTGLRYKLRFNHDPEKHLIQWWIAASHESDGKYHEVDWWMLHNRRRLGWDSTQLVPDKPPFYPAVSPYGLVNINLQSIRGHIPQPIPLAILFLCISEVDVLSNQGQAANLAVILGMSDMEAHLIAKLVDNALPRRDLVEDLVLHYQTSLQVLPVTDRIYLKLSSPHGVLVLAVKKRLHGVEQGTITVGFEPAP